MSAPHDVDAAERRPLAVPQNLSRVLAPVLKQTPGFSLAAVDAGGLRWSTGMGVADLRSGRLATAQTIYPWFSMTKIATATAVMQLVDRGQLDLDAPVNQYVPAFDPVPRKPGDPPVRVRHLLNHSAGLPNPLPITWVHPADTPGPDPHAFTRHLLAKHRRLRAAPGGDSNYSNLGYLLLGEVIAAVSGQSYVDFVREQLLSPLGMQHTDFIYRADMAPEAATGYQPRRHLLTPLLRLMLPRGIFGERQGRYVALRPFYVNGSAYGGLIGPVTDAARLLHLHLSGGTVDGRRLLSHEAVAAMRHQSATGRQRDVGLGWFRGRADSERGERFWEHLGGGVGFWTLMRLYPDEVLGVVVMGNVTRYDHQRIAAEVLRAETGRGSAI